MLELTHLHPCALPFAPRKSPRLAKPCSSLLPVPPGQDLLRVLTRTVVAESRQMTPGSGTSEHRNVGRSSTRRAFLALTVPWVLLRM